jgi:transposase InsO family protein
VGLASPQRRILDALLALGDPAHIRSDNGPEFIALALRQWIAAAGAKTAYIELGSPWENGYCESFNGKLRDELLNGEIFYTLKEAKTVIEAWRRHYTTPSALTHRWDTNPRHHWRPSGHQISSSPTGWHECRH